MPRTWFYPAANANYWVPKLRHTFERDRLNDEALRGAGWVVLRLWEHQPLDEAVARQAQVCLGPNHPSTARSRERLAGVLAALENRQ
jgi:G:T-mismatch repair DNA endonuclease (very short patch repair protein)